MEALRRDYSFTKLKGIDWSALDERYRASCEAATTPVAFLDAVRPMLAELRDLHVWTQLGDESFQPTFRSSATPNLKSGYLRSLLPNVRSFGDLGFVGNTSDNIVVVGVNSLPSDDSHRAMVREMELHREARAFIVDLRSNRGGSELAAQEIAQFFNDGDQRDYARTLVRDGKPGDGMRELNPRRFDGRGDQAFRGPVVCLVGPGCVSSGEGFALMMKSLDHVQLVGQPTRGASGNPRPISLGNGVRIWFSTWVSLELDGTPIEGRGVAPDIEVEHEGEGDPTFNAAVKWINELEK
ncbi:MAG: S41 family peptidase [Planctomycetota bacterium]